MVFEGVDKNFSYFTFPKLTPMRRITLTALFSVLFLISFGQPTLVKDINTATIGLQEGTGGANIFAGSGDHTYFRVQEEQGFRWWTTDGTVAGTHRIDTEIAAPMADDNTNYLAGNLNGDFIYTVRYDGGSRLKKYSPNENTTEVLKEFDIESTLSVIRTGDKFVFALVGPNNLTPLELWQSDGTSNGTTKLKTFIGQSFITNRANGGGLYTYFVTTLSNNGGKALWRTDGTESGTIELKPDDPGSEEYKNFVVVDDIAYFGLQKSGAWEGEFWTSDGSPAGTVKVKTLDDVIDGMELINSKIVIGTWSTTWVSDGSESGTVNISPLPSWNTTVYNGFYVGISQDYNTGTYYLMKSDGTPGGTSTPVELSLNGAISFNSPFPHVADKLIVQQTGAGIGSELAITDLTVGGISLLKDIKPGPLSSGARYFTRVGNKLVFLADDGIHNNELWITDGTPAGTELLVDLKPGTQDGASWIFPAGNNALFAADDGTGTDLWYTDGTEINTTKLFDTEDVSWIGTLNGEEYFMAVHKIYKVSVDGTQATLVKDLTSPFITQYGFRGIFKSTVVNGKLLFNKNIQGTDPSVNFGLEHWVTDGTAGGTHILKDINPGSGIGLNMHSTVVLNGKNFFAANNGTAGVELWTTDGTETGTQQLLDINPGPANSRPRPFFALNNKVYFFADDGSHGYELWTSDGTVNGTTRITDKFEANTTFLSPTVFNGACVFISNDDVNGWRLWKSDGTADGTALLKSFPASVTTTVDPGSVFDEFTEVNGKLYFTANDGIHGSELWTTDGTPEGTKILELTPGPNGTNPINIQNVNGIIYFIAPTGLWRTAGNVETSENFIAMGVGSYKIIGDKVYVVATTEEYGRELFVAPITKLNQVITLETITDKIADGPNFTINVYAAPGLPIGLTATPSGKVTINNNTVTIVAAGKVTITATQPGNAVFNAAADKSTTFCIKPVAPVVTLKEDKILSEILESTANDGNQWYLNGTAITGATAKTYEATQAGSYTVVVTVDECQSDPSAALVVQPLVKSSQSITFQAVTEKQEGGANFTLTASATSDLPVSFTATPSGKVTISGNTVTIVKPGKVTITAKQAGNELFDAAEDKSSQFCIFPAKPTVTLKEDKGASKVLQSSAADGNVWYLGGTPISGATSTTFEASQSGSYTVSSTVDGCAGEASTALVITITGIEEELNGAIFPNPANDKIFVRWNDPNETVGISIIDTNGRAKITTSFSNSIELPVSEYSTGIYLVRLSVGGKVVTSKFIKQ